jgi:integrase
MALSDAKVRNAKPQVKPFKIADGEGLFLWVMPTGSKYWRLRYFFAGKEKLLALGVYPDVSLTDARERRAQARKTLAAGNDPSEVKREAKLVASLKAENTFETVAREWHGKREPAWVPNYANKMLARLERYVFPKIGRRPVAAVTAWEVLDMLRVIEKAGALETVRIVKQMCGQVFMYAIATNRAERNPIPDLRGAFKTPVVKHHAYLKEADLPEFLGKLETKRGRPSIRLAVKFLLLTFVRTTELRGARWTEFDFEKAEWRIPAERMKMKELHVVPLSMQALEALEELKKHTGDWPWLFPNPNRPIEHMSENAIMMTLHRMGYKGRATGHGFRATASTILNENGFPPDVIERQLAHSERNHVRAAYNHAQYLPERRRMMQWWADYLDKITARPIKK